jgi:hypothetical protein
MDPLGFGVLVKISVGGDTSHGTAHFDLAADEPHFPCSALFLDSSNALILRRKAEQREVYTRIGCGKFLRTESQRRASPLFTTVTSERTVPYGPISDDCPKAVVTVY